MLSGRGTGVATYSRTLLAALRRAGGNPSILHDGDVRRSDLAKLIASYRNWPAHARPIGADFCVPDIFREAQVRFTRIRQIRRLRLPGPAGTMHWTYPIPLAIDGWRNLYTVHDAIPLLHPHLTSIDPDRHRRLLEAILAQGGQFISVTATAAAEIEIAFGLARGTVADLGQAVDVEPPSAASALPADVAGRSYFVAYGSVEPRKNLVRLAAAHRAAGTDATLVIAGPDGWQADGIIPALAGRTVTRLSYLDRRSLIGLIAGARAVLFPSLAEGFGLPIAEAMTLGTPVMTSRGGATAEVAGDAALLIDPSDTAAMTAAIRSLAIDDRLCSDLAARGSKRAGAWTVDAFADRLVRFHLG
jgi:glycosyltransferase involved in cell wall biosynthesis